MLSTVREQRLFAIYTDDPYEAQYSGYLKKAAACISSVLTYV